MQRIKPLSFASLLSLCLLPSAWATGPSCFYEHLKEASEINRSRGAAYASWSAGRSEEISKRLIRFEELGAQPGLVFDLLARKYEKQGVTLWCEDLVPMSTTPEFSSTPRFPDSSERFRKLPISEIQKALRGDLKTGGFEQLSRTCREKIAELSDSPHYNCLVRHFLESILRASARATAQIEKAEKAGLPSPEGLIRKFIQIQIFGMSEMNELDRLAAPLQKDGIPILCQDVPRIPIE